MARVFVTGASGCLGQRLLIDLRGAGYQVHAQIRNPADAAAIIAAGATPVLADLREGLPAGALQGVAQLYHCAALSSAWGPDEDFTAINVTATAHLLAEAQAAGVARFVFASSPSIYANGEDRLDLREDAALPAHFPSAYARSKHAAEGLVLAADRAEGMRCIALRPRAIYGIGDRSLLPRLLAAIKRGRVPLIEGGRSLIDLTHVSDAAQAMICAAEATAVGGKAYNVTSGEIWQFSQILDTVCAQSGASPRRISLSYGRAMTIAKGLEMMHKIFAPGREPVLTTQAVASLGRSLTLDISAARRDLGYAPQVQLAQGMQDYADVW